MAAFIRTDRGLSKRRRLRSLYFKKASVVQPSRIPWAAPALIVKKKDGSNRVCVDYRQLNVVTVSDSSPVPDMKARFDKLHGSRSFCAFDVLWGTTTFL